MRRLRLKTVWLAVFPFLWMSSPDTVSLLLGAGLALPGLWIRGWSAGTIHKDKKVAMTGPYALTRNPLYLGSFCIGLGVALAGGQWFWSLAFLAFYIVIYSKTMESEARHLTQLFPDGTGSMRRVCRRSSLRLPLGLVEMRWISVDFAGPNITEIKSGRPLSALSLFSWFFALRWCGRFRPKSARSAYHRSWVDVARCCDVDFFQYVGYADSAHPVAVRRN